MSDTPRTDAVVRSNYMGNSIPHVPADFARQLERELAAAREAIRGFAYDEVSDKESWARFKACLDGSKN